MTIATLNQVLSSTPYFCSLRNIERTGVIPCRLGGIYQCLSVLYRQLFKEKLKPEIYDTILSTINDTEMRHSKVTPSLVHVYTEDAYGEFCAMCCNTRYTERGYSENTLAVDCLYTNDKRGFDLENLPSPTSVIAFNLIKKQGTPVFDKSSIYFIKIRTQEILAGRKSIYYDYVFFIPKVYLMLDKTIKLADFSGDPELFTADRM